MMKNAFISEIELHPVKTSNIQHGYLQYGGDRFKFFSPWYPVNTSQASALKQVEPGLAIYGRWAWSGHQATSSGP